MAEHECNGCGDKINIGIDIEAINKKAEEIKKSLKELPPLKIEDNEEIFEDDGADGCYIDYSDLIKGKYSGMYSDPLIKVETCFEEENDKIRRFETGATRDQDVDKIDYEGFLSPIVLERFGQYMLKHQIQSNGDKRMSDNWQKGIPKDAYIKSAWRHFHDWWMEHRDYKSREGIEDALMGLLFNVMGYTYEILKEENKKESGNK